MASSSQNPSAGAALVTGNLAAVFNSDVIIEDDIGATRDDTHDTHNAHSAGPPTETTAEDNIGNVASAVSAIEKSLNAEGDSDGLADHSKQTGEAEDASASASASVGTAGRQIPSAVFVAGRGGSVGRRLRQGAKNCVT